MPTPSTSRSRLPAFTWRPSWQVISGLNLVLGFLLWLTDSTDLSIAGTVPSMVFAPAVAIVGLVTLIKARRLTGRAMRLVRLASLPLVIGGVPHLLFSGFLFGIQAILILPLLFQIDELASEAVIQRAVSPDGTRIAEVHFWPVGAYASGNGRVAVRVKHSLMPLFERQVYSLSVTRRADFGVTDYVAWLDNDTLYVDETQATIPVEAVKPHTPLVAALPRWLFEHWQATNPSATAPVNEVPIYPGEKYSDRAAKDNARGIVYRSFTVGAPDGIQQRHSGNLTTNPDRVLEWYRTALSEHPWTIVRVTREPATSIDRSPVQFCIQFERSENNGQKRPYYLWARAKENIVLSYVDVNISTPSPINELCRASMEQASPTG